jgi:hypothetical protein
MTSGKFDGETTRRVGRIVFLPFPPRKWVAKLWPNLIPKGVISKSVNVHFFDGAKERPH